MIKQLLSCIGEYKKDSILSPVYMVIEVILDILIPLYMADLIDFGIDLGDMGYVVKIGIFLIALALLAVLFGALSGRSAAIA